MLEIVLAVLNASTLIMVAVIQNTNTKNKKVEEEHYQRRLKHEDLTMNSRHTYRA
jgi:galactokinase